ncbi:NDR1/HIN1-like protein 12 [Impatiens glandulifera]|uniref:NDR1/HIN1-like protein 12 n=1 Tax=Impatiens glandulifera TaxID=253017 RepID=UPI001FB1020E|nr:NDR1/HIN1-like protein 12 [Impatiens glandulifera]
MAPINEESSRSSIFIPLDFKKYMEDQNRKHNDGTETDPRTANLEKYIIRNGNDDTETAPSKSITYLSWTLIVKIIVIIIFLIIRFVHPSKPEFIIQDATIFTFNLCTGEPPSSTTLLSSTLQITIASKNQNGLSADIYYHELSIYGEYKNQRVTYETDIPRSYQKNMEDNVWSLFINATNVPISPFNVPFLKQDQLNGIINLTIKLDGNVSWKVWSLNTRKYHIHVRCSATMDFGQGKFTTNDAINGDFLFPSVKYILFKRCNVVTV